jgi:hypothetical protein
MKNLVRLFCLLVVFGVVSVNAAIVDPIYEISLQGMVIQSTTNLLNTFSDLAPLPDNSIQIQSTGVPPPLYFQVKMSILQTGNVYTLTPTVFISFQASGPYSVLGDLDGISVTNLVPVDLFFRNSFNSVDTNIFYVDPFTFKWVAPQ